MIKNIPIAILLSLSLSLNAQAGQTEWQEVAENTRMRLISSDTLDNGKTLIGIEIDMPQSKKTYWRIPGETGIPMQLNFEGSAGVAPAHEIIWPFPTREEKGGYLDFVYRGQTLLPVRLEVDAADVAVSLGVMLGICDIICVPVRTTFELPLDLATPDTGMAFKLRQAEVLAPLPWQSANDPVGRVAVENNTMLAVQIDTVSVDPNRFIIDAGRPDILFALPQKSPTPGVVLFPLLGRGDLLALRGKPVRLTFMTKNGPFELTRVVDGG